MIDVEERVIIVDQHDRALGEAGKLDVHLAGRLHRAFSVFGFNTAGDMLLQKRALTKYHSPGLWANSCCGHPRPGEVTIEAAARRTHEELGFRPTLHASFQTTYIANVGNVLIEHEYVHVFGCKVSALPQPNPAEASSVTFVSVDEVAKDTRQRPNSYAAWFLFYFSKHLDQIYAMSCAYKSLQKKSSS